KSARSTLRPFSASAADRFSEVVVLPTPPFWFATAIIFTTNVLNNTPPSLLQSRRRTRDKYFCEEPRRSHEHPRNPRLGCARRRGGCSSHKARYRLLDTQ